MRGLDAPIARVTAAFTVLTVFMTWPLATGLARDVPGDLGDSLLNLWILGWGAEHVPRVVTGAMSPGDFWNANIFHPEPLALSFSEHLFGQVLQILPVYWLTGNLILAYNLLFLSSFILSGVGAYLLVREWLDGDRSTICWPAFVAGLVYAFVPYRVAQIAHIQTISSQWMPFALYGFLRFIRQAGPALSAGMGASTPRAFARFWPLTGGAAALLLQNWSCGYYLIYFAPFVVLVVVHQIAATGQVRDWRLWAAFGTAAVVVAMGTWPFLALYLDAQRVHGFERPIGEIMGFSADVYSYATAPEALRVWGPILDTYRKPEGELFFGVVPWVLSGVAAGGLVLRTARPAPAAVSRPVRRAMRLLTVILLLQIAGLVAMILTGGFVTSVAGLPVRATNAMRLLTTIALVAAALLVWSPSARQRVRAAIGSGLGLALMLLALAIWLSLGPLPRSMGRPLHGIGLYGVLHETVPGFEGLRVPARYAMIAALFLAVSSGYGFVAIARRVARPRIVAAGVGLMFLTEVAFVPMTLNASWGDGPVRPPARVEPASHAPLVYKHLAALDGAMAVAEFPFGDPAWELRYVYYSTVHWKRLVNGYSGGFPRSYAVRAALLRRVADQPDAAWRALADAGTTHVIVHEAALSAEEARVLTTWLDSHGARRLERFDRDVLYALPPIVP